jgi:hypothetical protein
MMQCTVQYACRPDAYGSCELARLCKRQAAVAVALLRCHACYAVTAAALYELSLTGGLAVSQRIK